MELCPPPPPPSSLFLLVSPVVATSEEILAAQLGYQKRMLASLCHGRWYQTGVTAKRESGTSLLNELYRLLPIVGSGRNALARASRYASDHHLYSRVSASTPVHMCNYFPSHEKKHDLAA